MSTTTTHIASGIKVLAALAEAIREAGTIPSGHLWAASMGHMDFETYSKAIRMLAQAGVIKTSNHTLTWAA
jgi:hypothetical protein